MTDDDICPYCDGKGHNYPHGHEGELEWKQRCWFCEGTGERPYSPEEGVYERP